MSSRQCRETTTGDMSAHPVFDCINKCREHYFNYPIIFKLYIRYCLFHCHSLLFIIASSHNIIILTKKILDRHDKKNTYIVNTDRNKLDNYNLMNKTSALHLPLCK